MAFLEPNITSDIASYYAANRARITDDRKSLVATRDALWSSLGRLGVGAQGILAAEVDVIVRECFEIWHRMEAVAAELPFRRRRSVDALGAARALARRYLDRISHEPRHMTDWSIEEVRAVIGLLDRDADMLTSWSASTRQIVVYDLLGQGRVAEVTGNLTEAGHLMVFVPGMGTDLADFDRVVQRRTEVVRTRAQSIAGDVEVAAVTWLGYDAPRDLDIVGAAREEIARQGSDDLSEFLTEIVRFAPRDVHVTVAAHSYGSVLAGLAAKHNGLDADDLIVLGSPGLGVETADELKLRPNGRVWAARAHDDIVTWVPMLEDRPLHLHGPAPTEPEFGARVLTVKGGGHSSYFKDPESVDALGAIVAGNFTSDAGAVAQS